MASSSPANKETKYKGNEIVIEFNEYFKLLNPSENVIISPPQAVSPSFKIKGKRLHIGLKDSLIKDITYIIFFNSCVADINEGNVLDSYSFVFSTGKTLDTNRVSGRIVTAPFLDAGKDVFVGVYEFINGNDFYSRKPKHICKTDNNGFFSLEHLSIKDYQLVVLEDMNQNIFYDLPNEQIGFYKDAIYFDSTNHKQVGELIMYENYRENELNLIELSPLSYVLNMTKKFDKNGLTKNEGIYIHEYQDSVFVWILDTVKNIRYRDNEIDTTIQIEPNRQKDSSKLKVLSFDYNIKEQAIKIAVNKPISRINKSSFCIEIDSIKEELDSILVLDPFTIGLMIKKNVIKNLNIKINESAIVDIYDISNEAKEFNIEPIVEKKLGELIFNISDSIKNDGIVWLVKDGKLIQEKTIKANEKKLRFMNLYEGSYSLYYVADENSDSMWTEGDYRVRKQAEMISLIKKNMVIRENWTYEDTIGFSR